MKKYSKGFLQILLIVIIAVIGVTGISYYAYKSNQVEKVEQQKNTQVSWVEATKLLQDCKVKGTMQSHNLDVFLRLKDGSGVQAKEPEIDRISKELLAVREKCGDILSGTE